VRWPELDVLRGCAAIDVVMHHMGAVAGGLLGVDVFFVLSGFLITTMIAREQATTPRIVLRGGIGALRLRQVRRCTRPSRSKRAVVAGWPECDDVLRAEPASARMTGCVFETAT
jgi:hypothetical protein